MMETKQRNEALLGPSSNNIRFFYGVFCQDVGFSTPKFIWVELSLYHGVPLQLKVTWLTNREKYGEIVAKSG